jgi:DNA replication and repair protein RecF
LLGSGKSFRQAKSKDFIKTGSDLAQVKGLIDHEYLNSSVKIEIRPSSKRIELNDKPIRKLRTLHSILPFVAFSPSDHRIIEGDAIDRRHFLNQALSSYDDNYADILSEYNRCLVQRNKLLKMLRELPNGFKRLNNEVEVWDIALAKTGAQLLEKRKTYLDNLTKRAEQEYFRIAKKSQNFKINYLAMSQDADLVPWQNSQEREDYLFNKWKDSARLDLASGTTNFGPHKDDLSLILDQNEAKFYGSQGEKRTGVLALRLAEVELLRGQQNLAPVLLVDDVSSELDSNRRQALVDLLRQEELQVLLTSTELPSALVDATTRPYEHIDLEKLGVGKL